PLARRSWRDVVWFLAPWLAAVALYVGVNLALTGSAAPATLGGRSWMWFDPAEGLSRAFRQWDFVETWALRLRNYTLGTSSVLAFWLSIGLAVAGAVRLIATRQPGIVLTLAWSDVHFLVYAIAMPTHGHGGRYQPLLPWMYLLCIA